MQPPLNGPASNRHGRHIGRTIGLRMSAALSGRSDLPARDFQTRRESIRARLHAQLVPLVAFDVQQPRVVRIERLAVDVDRREQRRSV